MKMELSVTVCAEWRDYGQIQIGKAHGRESSSLLFLMLLLLFCGNLCMIYLLRKNALMPLQEMLQPVAVLVAVLWLTQIEHCFFGCCLTSDVGNWLLSLVKKFVPTCEANILKLNLPSNDALDWTIAITLHLIWSSRVASKKANLQQCVAHLKAEAEIMKNTKFNDLAEEITGIIS